VKLLISSALRWEGWRVSAMLHLDGSDGSMLRG
jgi:hypothetical protein